MLNRDRIRRSSLTLCYLPFRRDHGITSASRPRLVLRLGLSKLVSRACNWRAPIPAKRCFRASLLVFYVALSFYYFSQHGKSLGWWWLNEESSFHI